MTNLKTKLPESQAEIQPEMKTAYLSLGANRGERAQTLTRAVELLENCVAAPDEILRVVARSQIYETQSIETGGDGDFLNAALRVETTLSPRELLERIREIETVLGRPVPSQHGAHRDGPRSIDIDILLFGDERIDEPDLQIPHPRMNSRAFVLRPLLDVLQGGWVRPSEQQWL